MCGQVWVAGMGADLFGSFAEATCAAMVIAGASGSVLVRAGFAVRAPKDGGKFEGFDARAYSSHTSLTLK